MPTGKLTRAATNGLTPYIVVVALLTGCSLTSATPVNGPVEAMEASWGPFSRQCATTRVSYFVPRSRLSPTEVTESHTTCMGFSAMPVGNGETAITASIGPGDQTSSPTIVRLLRRPGGIAHAAAPGDAGLLAQGSDDPEAASSLAHQIGLSERQMIGQDQTVLLLVRLFLPSPVDVKLSCRVDGEGRIHQRVTLILACTGSQKITTDSFVGQLQIAGVQEIDIQSGVRLASALSGRLIGQKRSNNHHWQFDNYRLFYDLNTEFE